MANAKIDRNFKPAMLAVSSADGTTPVVVYANPTTHKLLMEADVVSSTNTGLTDGEAVDVADILVGVVGSDGSNYQILKTDSDGNLQVDVSAALPAGTNDIGKIGHNITGIGHGVTTVTTAGTDVVLAASTSCKRVVIQAQTDNTNIIAVGGSGVDATIATGTGVVLYPGDTFELEIDNLNDVYIDSLVNGEGVRYTYFT